MAGSAGKAQYEVPLWLVLDLHLASPWPTLAFMLIGPPPQESRPTAAARAGTRPRPPESPPAGLNSPPTL